MDLRLTKHLRFKKDQKEFESYLKSNKVIFEVVQNILKEKLEATQNEIVNEKTYEVPNFSERVADNLARQRTLKQVIDLLEI